MGAFGRAPGSFLGGPAPVVPRPALPPGWDYPLAKLAPGIVRVVSQGLAPLGLGGP